ncbi:MAG: HNH endonuclease [Arcicella sp.]|jgi:hypothetical protein|nr:HNH endonuclease [Arcicella sp.]
MSRYISEALRKLVIERALYSCEYCRIHSENSFFTFHIEHIVSLKHGGKTIPENLAFACPICNLNKGTDIATFVEDVEDVVRFFHPRNDNWDEHFEIQQSGLISHKTLIGASTVKTLNLNHPDSIIERREMIRLKLL